MEILVPAAGLSTRFPGTRPKFTLTDHEGRSMLYRALEPYIGKYYSTQWVRSKVLRQTDSEHPAITNLPVESPATASLQLP
ncbi:MAG: portal protein [Bacteroidia bacterium]